LLWIVFSIVALNVVFVAVATLTHFLTGLLRHLSRKQG
jgi:hypothetical protein